LAYNIVWTIYLDPDGMLWFGTEGGGVSRYDGRKFVNFTAKDGLLEGNIKAICRDPSGAMWFGTWGGGVFRYDGRKFINFTAEDGLADDIVWAICVDSEGFLWFGTDKGVSRYDGRKFANLSMKDGLAGEKVRAIYCDSRGFLWFGTDKGVSRYDGERFVSFTVEDGLAYPSVLAICEDRHGALWFGTGEIPRSGGGGVSRYDGERFTNFTVEDGLISDEVRAIYCDSRGFLWFGTDKGVSRYDGERFINFTVEDGLIANHVNSIQADPDGALWFGTGYMISQTRGGLSRYDGNSIVNITVEDGLICDNVRVIHQDPDGTLWFGTTGGLSRYDGERFVNFTTKDGLACDMVFDIHRGPDGALWIGTWRGGVSRYDGERFINFSTEDGLLDTRVISICHDLDGALWFGTWRGGVFRYDGEGFARFTTQDGLVNDQVISVYCDPEGVLWFGTCGGVSRFDGREFVNFTTKDGLAGDVVSTIHQDEDGTLWFGTWGGGVSRYDGERFVNFTVEDGLSDNRVISICRDTDGVIWFGTDGGGVCGYDGTAWTTLDTRDGLPGNSVVVHCDLEEFLWLGTERGLARYRRIRTRPKVRIIAVTTDRRYTNLKELRPATAGNRITFEYSSVDFKTHPHKRIYRYRLDGYDKDWRGPTRRTRVDYADLPVGEYNFQVQAIDRDLNYSEPVTVQVEVQPDPRDVELVALQTEINRLRWEVGRKYNFSNIVGRSAAMKRVYTLMEKAIESDLTVLISGETGTGKELVAKAIHYNSPRRNGPLQELNCGAVPKELIASILFGYRRGAFTGADRDTMGLFESASSGTILLDEIGEMPLDAQVHLLRVLQERKVQRLGETRLREVDVRVITITNHDLARDVRAGHFREDLYYRLKVFPIHVPPLRERLDDIPLLAEHFLHKACRHLNKDLDGFADSVMRMLQSYPWPGNVRELENEIYRAVALAEDGMKLQTYHFSPQIARGESLVREILSETLSYSEALDQFRRRLIEETLRECNGNRTEAARRLGMHRPNLIRLMKRLGIDTENPSRK
jgi:DNA-binding NtrC family response regulator/ligand-binding sensor domain-containing protein